MRLRRKCARRSSSSPTPTAHRRRWCSTAKTSSSSRSRSTASRCRPKAFLATPEKLTIAQPPNRPFQLEIETLVDPARKHPAHGPLSRRRDLLHAMRGGRLSPHHLFPRPPGRDGGLHHAHRSRQSRGAGPALQRQSHRPRRRAGHATPLCGLARSVSKALLSVRAGRRRSRARRGQLHHHVRPQSRAAHLCRARQGGSLRLRHGEPQARHALGRDSVRARIRSRYFHDRRRLRLQHGRDGEQGPQHLQRQIRARFARDRDRHRFHPHRGDHRARIFPQLDRQPHHLPRLVSALPEGRA